MTRPTDLATSASEAFLRACRLDVTVRKPGNVSFDSPGHRMRAGQFIASARAAAPALCRPGARVGDRVEAAMRATWQAVGCNTNLGILLLCAPLAAAAEALPAPRSLADFQHALGRVLADLDLVDAQATFRAIALANPGGLGKVPQQDVRDAPSVGLLAAMALAAPRDRIAQQYAGGFADIFSLGWPALEPAHALLLAMPPEGSPPLPLQRIVLRVYLGLLAAFPDSHIVRKHGLPLAQSVMREAGSHTPFAGHDDPALAAWDLELKARGINPGSTADLTVASLMLGGLLAPAAAP